MVSAHCHKGFNYKLLAFACAYTALTLTVNETIQFHSHTNNTLLNSIIYVVNLISNLFLLIVGVVNTNPDWPDLLSNKGFQTYTHIVSALIFFILKIVTNIVWLFECGKPFKTDKVSIKIHLFISGIAALFLILLLLTMFCIIIYIIWDKLHNKLHNKFNLRGFMVNRRQLPDDCRCNALEQISVLCIINYLLECFLIFSTISASLLQATIENTTWRFWGFIDPKDVIC